VLLRSRNRMLELRDKKVLLIDSCQATREVREAVLRSHGVDVHAAQSFAEVRLLWQPNVYDLVMLDVRRYSPGEMLEFCERINASPRERIVLFVGPPVYLSHTWPGEVAVDDTARGQWGETVKCFLAAA